MRDVKKKIGWSNKTNDGTRLEYDEFFDCDIIDFYCLFF